MFGAESRTPSDQNRVAPEESVHVTEAKYDWYRTPVPSDIDGAYWTGVGICAHQSAMDGGVVKRVPVFE